MIFEGCTFYISSDVKSKIQLSKTIKDNGGAINFLIAKQVTHMITVEKEFHNQSSNIKRATSLGVHIVSETFVSDCIEKNLKLDPARYRFTLPKTIPSSFFDAASSNFAENLVSPKKVVTSPPPASSPSTSTTTTSPSMGLFGATAATTTLPTSAFSFGSTSPSKKPMAKASALIKPMPVQSKLPRPALVESNESDSPFTTDNSTSSIIQPFSSLGLGTTSTTKSTHQLIARPTAIKCTLYTFGAANAPAFPAVYEVIMEHTLQFTSLGDNNNKYYILELHEGVSPSGQNVYRLYTNYGRTDGKATKESRHPNNLSDALNLYSSVYNEKTKKGYQPVSLSAAKITSKSDSASQLAPAAPSKLHPQLQDLISCLFQEATAHLAMQASVSITANGIETPLGVLSMSQVEKGEAILDKLHAELKSSTPLNSRIEQYSSEFYTTIPHKMGRTKADVQKNLIRNLDVLSSKVELLQLMRDLLRINQSGALGASALDMKYAALKSDIEPLNPFSTPYSTVHKLVMDTSSNVTIKNIYKVARQNEDKDFNKSVTPTKLLFHGSRPANFVGILSRGMLLPKVIVNTGGSRTDFGFLGAGIYFADKFSTSCLYAHETSLTPGRPATRFILVSEVAVGMVNRVTKIDSSLTKPPIGYNSCLGVANNGSNNSDFKDNEYVIYNTNQQKQMYLVEFTCDPTGISTHLPALMSSSKPAAAVPASTYKPAPTPTYSDAFSKVSPSPPAVSVAPAFSFNTTQPAAVAAAPAPTSFKQPAATKVSSNFFKEFDKETSYREAFAAKNPPKDRYAGLEPVFGQSLPSYREVSNIDLSSEFVVMPFVHNQFYKSGLHGPKVQNSHNDFVAHWNKFSNNMFSGFDWSNVFVAGGAVLKCAMDIPQKFESEWSKSDIDLFFYGVSEQQASTKLDALYHFFKQKNPKMEVARTRYAVTFINAHPARNIQVVLRIYSSPAEVLMGFDIDSCSIGYDGHQVYALPRARRAIVNGINCVSMTRRSLTYESRLFKYAARGFAIVVPDMRRDQVHPNLFSLPLEKSSGLARLLLLEHRYVNSYSGNVSVENKSDYSECEIPSGQYWTESSMVTVINYKDKSQFFAKKHDFKHHHIVVTGYQQMLDGKSSWCRKCQNGESPSDDGQGDFVHGKVQWVTQNPGRQLLTGSFHPVNDQEYKVINNQPITDMSWKPSQQKSMYYMYQNVVGETDHLVAIASAYGNMKSLESLFPVHADLLNTPTANGLYPLHYACIAGNLEVVKFLLAKGALPQLRTKNYFKMSCLILARIYGHHALEQHLLRTYPHLAKLKCGLRDRKTFQSWRNYKEEPFQRPTGDTSESIFRAILDGNVAAVKKLLKSAQTPRVDLLGHSLYHYAVLSPIPKEMVQTLDSEGVNQSLKGATNKYGQSPRHFAQLAMRATKPICSHDAPFGLCKGYLLKELEALVTQLPLVDSANQFVAPIPALFLMQSYHQKASSTAPAATPQTTQSSFGVGGKFNDNFSSDVSFVSPVSSSPPKSPPKFLTPEGVPLPSLFGSPTTSNVQPSFFGTPPQHFFSQSLFASPTVPTLPLFGAQQSIDKLVDNFNSLQIPTSNSANYPDFLRPGFQQYAESSSVAKALALIGALNNRLSSEEVNKLRRMAFTFFMPLFNAVEAYSLDNSLDNLAETFKICLKLPFKDL
ncbi:hypothetical protein SAMD00019534_048740 [Acytostelium subglobosum LB1]|uniref:hypothetical protein n=1 Tax=Acytostelium subglobosum LB1 TaxID=1410327 RepID=UPI000644D97B|nr:hypothetical protein SAMD00019534_048740 [Acytostelium subglobosum LB1]GAM21699.1 hypothetical protein SAMD00019534_048740 [Acytostelium subglobosum LB1]|eukprot:XP_012755818.1 hypothetical protein SAMD00019534_048740 [Acytostelium subglobosum LB1]